jgi:hypothetical protein
MRQQQGQEYPMVQIVKHDLEFILKQIKIAEANSVSHSGSAATPLSELVSHHLLPYGLRTSTAATTI